MAKLQNPATMQWELTAECNHDCIHCYNYWRKDFEKIADLSKSKSEEEYLAIANKIVELKPVSVTLTGGEPLLVFDKIKASIELLQKNGIYITINTNAVLLNEETCEYLKGKGIHLFVSFPCAKPEICDLITNRPGAFERIVKSLDMLHDFGINFACNIVVSKKNIDYVEMTIDFLKDRYDAKYISVTRVAKPINSDDTFNEWLLDRDGICRLLDISVKKSRKNDLTIGTSCPYTPCSINSQEAFDLFGYQRLCTAGKTSFSIDTDGNFKACPRDSRMYGNILEDDFTTIYEHMHEWRDGSFVPDECKSCKEFAHCLGGCRVDSIPFTGRSDSLDCISDPKNLPLKFKPATKEHAYDHDVFVYDYRNVVSVENDNFMRLSNGRRFTFVTSGLYDFLIAHEVGFTNKDFAAAFRKDDTSLVDNVIGRLLSEGIIHKSACNRPHYGCDCDRICDMCVTM